MNDSDLSPALLRIPPQSLDGEQAVLGCMLLDREQIDAVRTILRPGDFYRTAHRRIYEAIVSLADAEEPVDILTVANQLEQWGMLDQAGGRPYLFACADVPPATSRAASYAERVLRASTLRALIDAGGRLIGGAYEGDAEPAALMEAHVQRIFQIQSRGHGDGPVPLRDVVDEVNVEIADRHEGKGGGRGVPCGFTSLEDIIGGFKPTELTIIAGRPSMGKSAACLKFVVTAAKAGVPVLAFSPEMSRKSLGYRLLSQDARIDGRRLETGNLMSEAVSGDEWMKLRDSVARLRNLPVWIDDRTDRQLSEVRAFARHWRQQHEVGMVAVDYAQLMARSAHTEDEMRHELGRLSVGLKALATELKVPVLLLSQLNRSCEKRGDHRPILSDLAESGDLEADADVVLFPFRPAYYDRRLAGGPSEEAEIRVAKHRNGPTRTAYLRFVERYAYFTDEVIEEPA